MVKLEKDSRKIIKEASGTEELTEKAWLTYLWQNSDLLDSNFKAIVSIFKTSPNYTGLNLEQVIEGEWKKFLEIYEDYFSKTILKNTEYRGLFKYVYGQIVRVI